MFHRVLATTVALSALSHSALAQRASSLTDKINEIQSRPELVHATFGVAVYDIDAKKQLFGLNAEQLFTPGSTTKLLTMGTALALLGADYRFHTPVYRTGPVSGGTLRGDLVLVANGDPNTVGADRRRHARLLERGVARTRGRATRSRRRSAIRCS